jgi:hypothetical protein
VPLTHTSSPPNDQDVSIMVVKEPSTLVDISCTIMKMNERVLLLGKPGCHLCDDARAVVAKVTAELGVGWAERSILDHPDLEAQYAELIPVVLVDGVQHDYWRVDPDRLRSALRPRRLRRRDR